VTAFGLEVLAIGAHPDDVEICCGGLVRKMTKSGYRVGILDLTRGETATRGTPEQRALEAAEASRVLHLSLRMNLELPDCGIDSQGMAPVGKRGTQAELLVGALRKLRPEVVLFPYPRCRHPDHIAAGELVKRAVFLAGVGGFRDPERGERFVPRSMLQYQMRYEMPVSFVVDVSAEFADKTRAIQCFSSQIGSATEDVQALSPSGAHTVTQISQQGFVSAIEARARYYGSMIGVEFGEPFFSEYAIHLPDPVANARFGPALSGITIPGRSGN